MACEAAANIIDFRFLEIAKDTGTDDDVEGRAEI
jgi:hypothetical protein